MDFHSKTVKETAKILGTSLTKGLEPNEVVNRLKEYGKNKLSQAKKTPIIIQFLNQFKDFMVIILIISAIVSAVAEKVSGGNNYIDSIIIIVIVVFNGIIGMLQESKANHALEKLKEMSQPEITVIRSGSPITVPVEDIVKGDLVELVQGEYVPADCRIIEANALQTDESSLTGESTSCTKTTDIYPENTPLADRGNMAYMGTIVVQGHGKAIITATGTDTQVGHISKMLDTTPVQTTPLQKKLGETGRILGLGALAICFLIFIIGLLRHIPVFTMFMTSISLAVAAIPEGLPAIVTVILAIGVQTMAKNNAIVKTLSSVEALGSATVICSDKTGTLTENKMKVIETTGEDNVIKFATLCCDATTENGEATEKAIVQKAKEKGYIKDNLEKDMPRVGEFPFSSERKMMTTIHKYKGEYIEITKGAPEYVLKKCNFYYDKTKKTMTPQKEKEILNKSSIFASQGLRVLAVSSKECSSIPTEERDLTFMGLIALEDSPREGAAYAVKECKRAGIRTIMITGDNPLTARAIGEKTGIGTETATGAELDAMSSSEFSSAVEKCNIFARVNPEHKYKIVEELKAKGEIVAMTGDGVNDAPALKTADIGCAMGFGGTDVARAAGDIILADDNFATIVKAVASGREMYENIKKSVHFLLSSNIGEIITIFTALLMGCATPLCPIQLLWVNLVTDSLPAIALGVDPCEENLMNRKPNKSSSIFSRQMWNNIIVEGVMIGAISLLAYTIGKVIFKDTLAGSAMCFSTLSICQLVHAFNMRSHKSIFKIHILGNKFLVISLVLGTALQIIAVQVFPKIFKCSALNTMEWLVVIVLSFIPIVLCEIEKRLN